MDWHKLQKTLYSIEPTDPKEDLAKLQANASRNGDIPPTKDYVTESVSVPAGSMPLNIDSVSDFAALAGITVKEGRQKPADQVRGSEPMPKAKKGRSEHPFRDRLVGSVDNDVEEGPLDSFKQGFQSAGASDWAEKKLKGLVTPNDDNKKPKTQSKDTPKKKADPQKLSRMFGVNDPAFRTAIQKINQPGEQNINASEAQALAKAFANMMNMNSREIQRNMSILKTQVSGNGAVNKESESIKERLYRELRKKGL